MLPAVAITESCLSTVCAELDRVSPREGLAVPLVWLKKRAPEPSPGALLRLEQIEQVVVAAVLLVPPEKQLNASVRVGVLAHTDSLLADATRSLVRRHPRLRACAYLHSHPFARGWTRPSRGPSCDYEGHMLPLLARNREAGLATSFSFIACRSASGDGWALHAFALDEEGAIVDLGLARPVPDSHPEAVRALAPPLTRRPAARLVRAWLRKLRRAGLAYRVDELFDGWHRIIVEASRQVSLVALVPVSFPRESAQLLVWDKRANTVEPRSCEEGALGRAGALARIARSLLEVDHGPARRLLLEGASADRGGAQPPRGLLQ